MAITPQQAQRAAELIKAADGLVIAAGAGMGVDSGLPDFRGNEGFWKAYPALGQAKINFTSMASPAAFHSNIRRAWGFYGHRLALYRNTKPHAGFALLKQWGEQKAHGYHVFTSNVDGQFQAAGFAQDKIHECHGSIHHVQCLDPCSEAIWPATNIVPEVDVEQCALLSTIPKCTFCGGHVRPNILMFGDGGWIDVHAQQQAEREYDWLQRVNNPVVIELGAGVDVASVRYFSQTMVRQYNARLIRINPREPQVDNHNDIGIAAGALSALQAISQYL